MVPLSAFEQAELLGFAVLRHHFHIETGAERGALAGQYDGTSGTVNGQRRKDLLEPLEQRKIHRVHGRPLQHHDLYSVAPQPGDVVSD
jgi:hypothetical protein